MKKFLCVLLAALMLLSVCACGNSTEAPSDTDAGSTEAATEVETREPLDIPDTKYNEEFTFLTKDAGEWSTVEICPEDPDHKDNISQAVYERNEIVRAKYGIQVSEIKTTDISGNVNREVSAPTGDFVAVTSNLSEACSMLQSGYLTDLNSDECEYMDFDKPWWDGKLAQNMTISGHLYFATGDLLINDNDGTFIIMFNKSLAKDCQLPDMYELVNNKQWTMDKMYEFELKAVNDKDGDGKLAYDSDVCGFAYTGDTPYSLLYAGGVTIIVRGEDDELVYNLDIQRASDVADKARLVLAKDCALDMNTVPDAIQEVGKKCFGEGHCLFFGECMQCVARMRGYDVDFGIVPYPKFDEEQSQYYSVMEWVGTVVSIPRSVSKDKLPMVSSMIEAMAYYAVDTLTEQYYEINLKTKLSKDEESGPMIDLILEYRVYDLAYAFQWNGVVGTLAGTMRPGSKNSPASASAKYKKQLENTINKLIKNIEKFES